MKLSVIIPTYCEADRVGRAVCRALAIGDEVVVVDAGSLDGTAELAVAAGALVLVGPKGRGAQLALGARAASGDVFLFLHADAEVPRRARRAIAAALTDPEVVGGNFHKTIQPETLATRALTAANDLGRRYLDVYFGDSGIFVRRTVYEDLGGFSALPLMEDYDFCRRLERTGKTVYLRDVPIQVDARWLDRSPLTTLVRRTATQVLFSMGVPADWLVPLQQDARTAHVRPELDRAPPRSQNPASWPGPTLRKARSGAVESPGGVLPLRRSSG